MTNSDTTFGVHNVQYMLYCEHKADGSGTVTTNNFANVDAAKAYFFHADALTMFEANCTWLGWKLPQAGVDAGQSGGLIMARGFGIVENAATKSHAVKFQEDKAALSAADKFFARANILGVAYDVDAETPANGREQEFDGTNWVDI